LKGYDSPVILKTAGGELKVSFKAHHQGFSDIYLIGPARSVFQGVFNNES
jgi:diaminopimelate epimerase